ncbi:nucleotidyltransferase (plasmid) [Planococcus maritimus]|uniref:Nucleotidyltransferase n=1 Tax=Planococcus maritimus TaxID=192421 RepID=A0A7D7RGC0_PLAMR|nr:nucleotidyltransferase [Planococcus maritimus]QMT19160.1 nucleotidyltransferase [Planococcus maritimus]
MAKNIYTTLKEFSKNKVDLDPTRLETARSSRDWLVTKIENFENNDVFFPHIYKNENNVQMGSFARRTKIRPLDDIDFLVVFTGNGGHYNNNYNGEITISIPETASRLKRLTNDDSTLNSIKLLNKLKSFLSNIPQYSGADIKRNQEAITLKLNSYDWNFDIVPAFITAPDNFERTYYLIPDGNGKWKKTDPRIDAKRATSINQQHNGEVLRIIRLVKAWHSRTVVPDIGSYLLENLILNYFESNWPATSDQSTLANVFHSLSQSIYRSCQDPKGIQGDLNSLSYETKSRFSEAASKAYLCALNAIDFVAASDHEAAHAEWQTVFGGDFPEYG